MYTFTDEPNETSNRMIVKSVVTINETQVVQMIVLRKLAGVFVNGGITEDLVSEANTYLTGDKFFCFTTVEGG